MATTGARMLIVDDDPDIRANLADILTDVGYEVETAATARAGPAAEGGAEP